MKLVSNAYWYLPVFVIAAFAGLAVQTNAVSHTVCSRHPVSIDGGTEDLRLRACEVVAHVSEVAASCDLRLKKTLYVHISPDRALLPPGCSGTYDCLSSLVILLAPEKLEDPAAISRAAMFEAVLMHETVHAMVSDELDGRVISRLAEEYVAYALQLESMSQSDRQKILNSQGAAPKITQELLNFDLLRAAPDLFGSAAWLHFKQPQNGCRFVADLLSGDVVLGRPVVNSD
ncbi:MAG: hypothetical protein QNJ20_11280 [Paracoccaceae bacterium]|nr:hypothetical protein [Paracoccaceae bacterium]